MYSLQNSEFADFLYAPIGEEENGMVLTVLSALARIGVDPWQEAGRLTGLPAGAATEKLASLISGLPNGRWAKSDAGAIAARLIALLPAPKAPGEPSRASGRSARPRSYRLAVFAVLVLLNAAMFFAFRGHDPSPVFGQPDRAASAADASPSAPLAGSK